MLAALPLLPQPGRSPKRGIAYGNHTEADLAAVSGGVSWWYNWYHQPEAGAIQVYRKYDLDFVPMTWNNRFNEAGLRAFYAGHPEARYLLAFNEPNFISQANMKPSEVVAAWPRLEAIARDYGLEIVGPAVNWCGQCVSEGGVTFTNPYAYLDTFFTRCRGCRVDYIAVHNYMCYGGALADYLEGFKKYGKKIWLTEYACWDQENITLAMQKNLMKSSIDLLENDTMVFRYSWFTGNRTGGYPYLDLFAPEPGKLTELGQFYVTYRAWIPDPSFYTPVPGRIEAEHYTTMTGVSTEETSDFDGTDNVGWIDAGDWLTYNLDIPDTARYYLYLRMAATGSSSVIFRIDGQNSDTLKMNPTGGWQAWKTVGRQITLPAGKHTLTLYTPTGGFNLNWLRISGHANKPPTVDAGAAQLLRLPQDSTFLTATAKDDNNDSLRYSWKRAFGPATCTIREPASGSTLVTGLSKARYIFEVTVSDGTELASDRVTVEVTQGTGLEEPSSGGLFLYPNPAGNRLFIRNAGLRGITGLTLTDLSGRRQQAKLLSGDSNFAVLDVSGLAPGLYLLKATDRTGSYHRPVVKW